jgi:pantoate--beta-alanine ligase
MGYLHEGHLALIRAGLKRADIVVTTIFVNPTQFAPYEDFTRYPRDLSADLKKIRSVGGQVVFVPSARAMYSDDFKTYVTVEDLTQRLEGAARPTHFRGVTTIVAKLLNIVRPDIALFGMKDYQQAIVLRRMVRDLNFPVKFLIRPTIREKDGLAMSSRNNYLTASQRRQAPAIYRSLKLARSLVRGGLSRCAAIERRMRELIDVEAPLAEIEYIAFTDFDTLREVNTIVPRTVASMAVRFKSVRLIDNLKIS